jgi:hypothetical protein
VAYALRRDTRLWRELLATACLSVPHATQFVAFVKQKLFQLRPELILSGEQALPLQDRDLMYFLVLSLRAYLYERLPRDRKKLSKPQKELVNQAYALVRQLTGHDGELTQLLLGQSDAETALPAWFIADLSMIVPTRLADKPQEAAK